ncbi:MAG: hypothetical protein H6Q84_2360, partial [Deltaproteobacteria bacterium]|nr:hypothetical protein [Deltaproteobacteria bacterium]
MNRREFLRFSAVVGASLTGGGLLSGCDWESYLALYGVRIVDPHAHPDQFYSSNPDPDPATVDDSSTLGNIVGVGMAASSFSAIGDLRYLGTQIPGVGEYESTIFQLAKVQALADAGRVTKVLKASDIPQASGAGIPPGAILSIEGGDALTSDTVGADPFAIASARLDELYGLGVRIVTLIHYRHNDLGDAQSLRYPDDPALPHGGLTPLGAHVVTGMQEKGMLVDVAHASANTLADVVEIARAAKKPIVDSHTGLHPDGDMTHYRRLRTLE